MGAVLVTFKIMPESPETNLAYLEKESLEHIQRFGGTLDHVVKEPVAFGIVALLISFRLDEQQSNLDPLEDQLRNIEGVSSVDVIDVRRAIG